MSRTGILISQIVLLALGIAAVVMFGFVVRDSEERRSPEVLARYLSPAYLGHDRRAPDFDLTDATGRHVRLSSLRGKVVVLHFWSRTCIPCIVELQRSIPAFEEIMHDRADIALLLVSVDAGWNAVAPIVPVTVRSPVLFDPTRRVVAGLYGTRLFPETWVVDREGVVRARFDHAMEWDSSVWLDYLASLR